MRPTGTTLSGLTIVNFNSLRNFHFSDNTLIPGCSIGRAKYLALRPVVNNVEQKSTFELHTVEFKLTKAILTELRKLHDNNDIDLVIVSTLLLQILKDNKLSDTYYKCVCPNVGDGGRLDPCTFTRL